MKVSRSARAVGSQFSLTTREALVCGRKRKHIPSCTFQSRNWARTRSVMSCKPLPWVEISRVVLCQFIGFCWGHELTNGEDRAEEAESQHAGNARQDPHQDGAVGGLDARLQGMIGI